MTSRVNVVLESKGLTPRYGSKGANSDSEKYSNQSITVSNNGCSYWAT